MRDEKGQYVAIHGEKIYLNDNYFLDLSRRKIKDLNEIVGLGELDGLRGLNLGNYDENDEDPTIEKEDYNKITEFKIFKSLKSLERLDLSYNFYITELPEIDQIKSLKELNLRYCYRLQSLTPQIGNLVLLKNLNLGGFNGYIKELPDSIGSLKNLQELIFENFIELKSLPESIFSMTSLKILNFWGCKSLISLPKNLWDLNNLIELGISSQKITLLPNKLRNFQSLQILQLYCKNLISITKYLEELKSLKELRIRSKKLTSLPKNIGNLQNLEILDLYKCKSLLSLPKSIGNLQNLQNLNLNQCEALKSLPKSIGNLRNLQTIEIKSKSLKSIPSSIGNLQNLQKIELISCETLKFLPVNIGNLKNLQSLDLRWSESLKSIPLSIGNLQNLQKIDLRYCISLTNLPESIGNLQNLLKLNLSWCEALKTLPESIGNLKNLRSLDLKNCYKLISLPESIGNLQNLEKLKLYSTEFGKQIKTLISLPESIWNLNNLKTLDLSWCKVLTFLPDNIKKLQNLQTLDLSNCGFKKIPTILHHLHKLKILTLDKNPFIPEEERIADNTIPIILDYLKRKTAIEVFFSHAVVDFKKFKIKMLSDYLEQQKEVYQAYFCEEDLKGNIDDFMNNTIPGCQLLLFFASHDSLYKSIDCYHELELANKNRIPIIPIKGDDVNWSDLAEVGLSRELGLEFNANDFNKFCKDLYQYIVEFKRKIDLIDKDKGIIDKSKLEIYNMINEYLSSPQYNNSYKDNIFDIEALKKQLKDEEISFEAFLIKLINIIKKNKTNNNSL